MPLSQYTFNFIHLIHFFKINNNIDVSISASISCSIDHFDGRHVQCLIHVMFDMTLAHVNIFNKFIFFKLIPLYSHFLWKSYVVSDMTLTYVFAFN